LLDPLVVDVMARMMGTRNKKERGYPELRRSVEFFESDTSQIISVSLQLKVAK
jgi:hypothetical protein